jgi:hypothetical protein
MTNRGSKLYQRSKYEFLPLLSIIAVTISFLITIISTQYCLNHQDRAPLVEQSLPTSQESTTVSYNVPCIDVEGKVFGDIIHGSRINLYQTSSTEYDAVMGEIRTEKPIRVGRVNESEGFKFNCLFPGKYTFVIPSSSYNGSVGSPLPYVFECQNIFLDIAFQGGDMDYAVGAFSIIYTTENKKSECIENPELCPTQKDSLYKECPFDLGYPMGKDS